MRATSPSARAAKSALFRRPGRRCRRTLTELIQATGNQLAIELVAGPRVQLGLPDTRLGRRPRRHRRSVLKLAALRGARNIRVFGSVARGEDTETSDIDLLVDLDDGVGVVTLAGLRREMAELLGTDVDIVPATALKPGIQAKVLAEAIAL